MGRIKKSVLPVICLLALMLTACGSQTETSSKPAVTDKKEQSVKEETDKKKDEKNTQSGAKIPEELLPGQETEQAADDRQAVAKSEDHTAQGAEDETMEIVEEDGTVYRSDSSQGGTKSGGGKQPSAGVTENGSSGETSTQADDGTIEISFSIDSSAADGSVSYSAVMTLDRGASVYDALAASGVSHSGKSYITAIGGLSEGMFGGQSGWKYYVNGSAPNTSCVNYTLQDGDRVQWKYVQKA